MLKSCSVVCALLAIASVETRAQTLQITGRVLERAAMDPVPGATVRWNGGNPQSTTDAQGRFTLSGVVGLADSPLRFEAPYFRNGRLRIVTVDQRQTVAVKVYNAQGERIASHSFALTGSGPHDLSVLPDQQGSFMGFVTVAGGGQSFRFKIMHHREPIAHTEAEFVSGPKGLGKSAALGPLDFSMTGLVSKAVSVSRPDTNVGDIILDYPARSTIGVGAAIPYASTVLFDGTQGRAAANQALQSNWQDWPRFTPVSTRQFRIARDPQFLSDTNRVTLQSCCNTLWGYDDIQATVGIFQDAQVHVEFVGMGEYDSPNYDPANPNNNMNDSYATNTSPGYINSGVYVASRYEIQINSFAQSGAPGSHDMGSIVDQYAAASNQNRPNGTWQAYDITFRGARFNGATMTTTPYMTVWWNGVQVHNNRVVNAGASGLSNHSGEEHLNTTLYGLKLQSEGRDVRFRKVWIKKLKIDSTGTNFGY